VISNVLAELQTYQSALTQSGQPCGREMAQPTAELHNALTSSCWVDETHLEANAGDGALNQLKLAALELAVLSKHLGSGSQTGLQSCLDRLSKAARLLAVVRVNESAATMNPQAIQRALAEVDKGDSEAAAGRVNDAVEYYRNAWRLATRRNWRN
jgi:hypothetical protein